MEGIALVGFGYWGPNLARNLNTHFHDAWRYLVDLSPERLRTAAPLYPSVEATADLDRVLADRSIFAMVIATPAVTHVDLVRRALRAGKHVLVEKPLALSAADGAELAALADDLGLVLMVGHTFEYVPAVRAMRDLIRAGEIGDLLYLHSQRLNLGRIQSEINAFWSIGPHDVSISNYLIGSSPRWVAAQGAAYLHPNCEDVTFVTLGYDGGVLAHLHVSWLDPVKTRRVTVVGSGKMLHYDDLDTQARLKIFDKGADQTEPDANGVWQYRLRDGAISSPRLDLIEPLAAELNHFLRCAQTGQRPDTDGWNGVRVVAACEAADASLRAGGARVDVNLPSGAES